VAAHVVGELVDLGVKIIAVGLERHGKAASCCEVAENASAKVGLVKEPMEIGTEHESGLVE
jgi:hypothetical protein